MRIVSVVLASLPRTYVQPFYRGRDMRCLARSRGLECAIVPFGSLFECFATSLFELSISWQISVFPCTHVFPPSPILIPLSFSVPLIRAYSSIVQLQFCQRCKSNLSAKNWHIIYNKNKERIIYVRLYICIFIHWSHRFYHIISDIIRNK